MSQQWFKFYGAEYLSDPKILQLTPAERSCWVTLLCLASQTDDGCIAFLSEEKLMALSGLMFIGGQEPAMSIWEETTGILKKLESLKMVKLDGDLICITNYKKRQNTYLTPSEKMKRYRAKKSKVTDKEYQELPEEVTVDTLKERKKERNKEIDIGHSPSKVMNLFLKDPNPTIEKLITDGAGDRSEVEEQVSKFISHWTEPTKSGKLQKWQTEKTFELDRRLKKWFNNYYQWNK